MRNSSRLADFAFMLLAALLGGGSVLLFAAGGAASIVTLQWPEPARLAWDAALSLAFFIQHSGMVRQSFHTFLSRTVPGRNQGVVYAIASGIVLALVALLWQRSGTTLYHLHGIAYWLVLACATAGFALFLWSVLSLRLFDPLGLAPVRAHLRGREPHTQPLTVRGPYRQVRHPIYLSILILFWSTPVLTADRLLLNVLWSAWIVVGTLLEERDLAGRFGDSYRSYQKKVPMLIPWRRPSDK